MRLLQEGVGFQWYRRSTAINFFPAERSKFLPGFGFCVSETPRRCLLFFFCCRWSLAPRPRRACARRRSVFPNVSAPRPDQRGTKSVAAVKSSPGSATNLFRHLSLLLLPRNRCPFTATRLIHCAHACTLHDPVSYPEEWWYTGCTWSKFTNFRNMFGKWFWEGFRRYW